MKFRLQQVTRPGMSQWKYVNTLKELIKFIKECEHDVIITFDEEKDEPVLTIIDNLEK